MIVTGAASALLNLPGWEQCSSAGRAHSVRVCIIITATAQYRRARVTTPTHGNFHGLSILKYLGRVTQSLSQAAPIYGTPHPPVVEQLTFSDLRLL